MTSRPLRAPATLAGLRDAPSDPLILAVRDDGRPLKGLTGLVDWRTGGLISDLVKSGAFSHDHPVLRPSPDFLNCGRVRLWRLGAATPADMRRVIRDLNVEHPGICPQDFDFSEDEVRAQLGPQTVMYDR